MTSSTTTDVSKVRDIGRERERERGRGRARASERRSMRVHHLEETLIMVEGSPRADMSVRFLIIPLA